MSKRHIFVFGSNLAGRHGKGAALFALHNWGALYGVSQGLQGNSYAIPTKDHKLHPLPICEIDEHVCRFLKFARQNPGLLFIVTRIGCGLAGHTDSRIAPLFTGATTNCQFDEAWRPYLEKDGGPKYHFFRGR